MNLKDSEDNATMIEEFMRPSISKETFKDTGGTSGRMETIIQDILKGISRMGKGSMFLLMVKSKKGYSKKDF